LFGYCIGAAVVSFSEALIVLGLIFILHYDALGQAYALMTWLISDGMPFLALLDLR
jgi:uncharacterized membrane protein